MKAFFLGPVLAVPAICVGVDCHSFEAGFVAWLVALFCCCTR